MRSRHPLRWLRCLLVPLLVVVTLSALEDRAVARRFWRSVSGHRTSRVCATTKIERDAGRVIFFVVFAALLGSLLGWGLRKLGAPWALVLAAGLSVAVWVLISNLGS